MTIRMAAFSGFCPVNLEDECTLIDGTKSMIRGIRTIHEMVVTESGNEVGRTFFQICLGNMEWIPVERVSSIRYVTRQGQTVEKVLV